MTVKTNSRTAAFVVVFENIYKDGHLLGSMLYWLFCDYNSAFFYKGKHVCWKLSHWSQPSATWEELQLWTMI